MRYYTDVKRTEEARLETVDPEPSVTVTDVDGALRVAQAALEWLYDTDDCHFCRVERGPQGEYIHEDFCPLRGLAHKRGGEG